MRVNIEIKQNLRIGNDKSYFRNLEEVFDSLIIQKIIDFDTAKTIIDKIEYYGDENIDRNNYKIDELEDENYELSEEISNLEDENFELRMKVNRLEEDNTRLFKKYMANLPGRLE